MPEDRLRHDRDEVEQLGDIIEAREEGTSPLARDVDAAETDFDIPEDIDVDEALTFPHPKRKRGVAEELEMFGSPADEDVDIDWRESQHDLLPSDYGNDYDDALTTHLEEEDELAEQQIGQIGDVTPGELADEEPMVIPTPGGFRAEQVGTESDTS